MYALFKDGKQISGQYNNLPALWNGITTWHPFTISGIANTKHFSCSLEKGYTIEEVKE